MNAEIPIGLSHISYYLPPKTATVEELAGPMNLSPEKIRLFKETHGLKSIHVAEGETATDIAIKVAKKVLQTSGIDPREIDVVIFHHTLYNAALAPNSTVGEIQHELGLTRAVGFSIWEQYCASIIVSMRVARAMIRAGSAETILLVGADSLMGSADREIEGVTLMSDGGSAMIVRRNSPQNQLIEISNYNEPSLYKGITLSQQEYQKFDLIYFLVSTRAIQKILRLANLTLEDISLIIPHNINISSWNRISSILRFDRRKLFLENIERHGHVFGDDMAINLSDAIETGRLAKGEYALLFTAGLGACWGCAIVRH